jgi:hypothetical protein
MRQAWEGGILDERSRNLDAAKLPFATGRNDSGKSIGIATTVGFGCAGYDYG